MNEIARGAEAVIYKDSGGILKERPPKSYRHPLIDTTLRKQRMRKEAKTLLDLKKLGLLVPELIELDEPNASIRMSEISGRKIKDVLNKRPELGKNIGSYLTCMHQAHILHGDLTTSNMILSETDELYFIDFGLSYHSRKIEDKAVDLHLFLQALESAHHEVKERAWKAFLEGYSPENKDLILKRLEEVEQRGRNKH